jgi:hypothetical protein
MATYAQKHEGLLVVGEIIRVGKPWARKRDQAAMLSLVVKVDGEDVPVKHEVSVPASRFTGEPREGDNVIVVGTAGEYNGSAYLSGYSGASYKAGELGEALALVLPEAA